ncbi:MAG: hypothetical protein Q8O67_07315 [Deltaproteobacteria bacterium]|nr:hypothetical protein [Deltaproteobacteria bacterium]
MDVDAAAANGLPYEPDVTSSDMLTVGVLFVVLTGLLFGTLGGLFVYFHHAADEQQLASIGNAPTTELNAARAAGSAALGDVEPAMKAIAAESNQE